jgi:putative ABC transport system permease protein
MLQLKGITKNYKAGTTDVQALRGVNLAFRDNEFAAILGPSGCGKTTMLNILGGLDRYTSGDLIINGKSTKSFTDREWDTYRNRKVGFVFQNYNLITHQTVLSNVELAMTLSGVGKTERRRRAMDALSRVGLSDQAKKKPNQMSGGQMQRVAIARALVNNPDILMADEPTGALDSETSVQIMDILREIATDRLVIMVTHNGDLADQYANRIVRLLDGQVLSDTRPFDPETELSDNKPLGRKTSMGFFTALSLSLNNLMTKKARTFLTAFAGSIGIIGIALILSLSNGMQSYIDKVQRDTLSSYPLQIQEQTADLTALFGSMSDMREESQSHEDGKVYSLDVMSSMVNGMTASIGQKNDLGAFKEYLEAHKAEIDALANNVTYSYNVQMNIYKGNPDEVVQLNPAYYMAPIVGMAPGDKSGTVSMGGTESQLGGMGGMSMMSSGMEVWYEMLPLKMLDTQYDVIAGKWPSNYDEIIIHVNERNEITDYTLYALGLKDTSGLKTLISDVMSGKGMEAESLVYEYEDLLGLTYKLLPNAALYEKTSAGLWQDRSANSDYMRGALNNALTLKVVGIVRQKADSDMAAAGGFVGYTPELTQYMIDKTMEYDIVKSQLSDESVDIFSSKPFADPDAAPEEFDISQVPEEYQAMLAGMTDEQIAALMEQYSTTSDANIENNFVKLGVVSDEHPNSISIYPKDFEAKDGVVALIDSYNTERTDADPDAQPLRYTDFIGLLMSSVSNIINAISYLLIGFVSISLVVSSIMIGIITFVSVLERTKEIGVLKSIGASKGDIATVFNAESLTVGLAAGLIGIGITLLINIPANAIIEMLTDIPNVSKLPPVGGVLLVVLSCALTFIAGLIPSRVAANKDPVVALRTE